MARLHEVLKEATETDSKLEEISRNIAYLNEQATSLRARHASLVAMLEERHYEWSKLEEECGEVERKTKNLFSIEGLTLGEKETHATNLRKHLAELEKEKEQVNDKLERKKEEIKKLFELYEKATGQMFEAQARYRILVSQLLQNEK